MPIEFPCPHCGKLMRTPDASAGKKGRCPDCGGVAKIPDRPPVDSAADSGARGTDSSGAKAGAAGGGKIEFSCVQCGHAVRVPISFGGKKGKCPHCQAVMQIPNASSSPGPAPSSGSLGAKQPAKPAAAPTGAAARAGQPIDFPCPQCGRQVKTPAAAAGKKGKCPHCTAVIQIPNASPLKTPGPNTPGIVEAAPDELTELPGAGGLTPLGGSGGLTPLPDPGGLTPVDDAMGLGASAGLGAIPDDPLGLGGDLAGGGAADPFADLGAGQAMGGGQAMGANPYASPSPSATPSRKRRGGGGGGKRKGLPWDREEEGGFFGTVKLILFEPTTAFTRMKVSGGVGRPMLFAVYGSLFGAVITSIFQGILVIVMLVIASTSGAMEGADAGAAAAGAGLQAAVQIFGNIVGSVMGAAIGCFISAAFLHVLLMLFQGANGTYETTYRVVAYTTGAMSCLTAIPCFGPLIVVFAYPVYMIIAAAHAHETDGWRAACAVLFPYALCCVGGIFLIITMIGVLGLAASS